MGRCADGILGVCMSLRCFPTQVRVYGRTPITNNLCNEIAYRIQADDLYTITPGRAKRDLDTAMIIVMDRGVDLIPPLLSKWTYQSMIHELIGINNNKVKLSDPKTSEVSEVCIEFTCFPCIILFSMC